MSVGVIGDKCDVQNVISVDQCCVGSVGVIEYDGFFIVLFIRELGGGLCNCAGIKVFFGCYERDYFFVGWVMIRAGNGVMFILVEDQLVD